MSRSVRPTGARFVTDAGVPVLVEESHAVPIVDIEIAFRAGSYSDPAGKEGLSRLVARMVRMGTRRLTGAEVEDRIARLGARLTSDVAGGSTTRFHGSVIRRNLEPFVALLGELLTAPAFRADDLAHVKRETISDLVAMRDHDEALAAKALRNLLFDGHPYGRSIAGTPASVRRVTRADLVAHHRSTYLLGDVVVGAAGDVSSGELARLVDRYLVGLPRGRAKAVTIPAPRAVKGRRVCIVDKPERTQTQIYVGSLAGGLHDPKLFPLHVGNAGFGGMFTGRLMHEVRAVRGLSYGASSRMDPRRRAFEIHTFPTATDAVECTALVLELVDRFVAKGLSDAEVRAAKTYLVRGHCFEVDTASKRLDARMDVELYGLPAEHYTDYERLVSRVKASEVREAVRSRLSSRDLAVAIVATASDVRDGLAALPGVRELTVVPFDRV